MKLYVSYNELMLKNIDVEQFMKAVKFIGYEVRIGNHGLVISSQISPFENRDIVFTEMKHDISYLINLFN